MNEVFSWESQITKINISTISCRKNKGRGWKYFRSLSPRRSKKIVRHPATGVRTRDRLLIKCFAPRLTTEPKLPGIGFKNSNRPNQIFVGLADSFDIGQFIHGRVVVKYKNGEVLGLNPAIVRLKKDCILLLVPTSWIQFYAVSINLILSLLIIKKLRLIFFFCKNDTSNGLFS